MIPLVPSTDPVSLGAYPSRYPKTTYGVSKPSMLSPPSPEQLVVAVAVTVSDVGVEVYTILSWSGR